MEQQLYSSIPEAPVTHHGAVLMVCTVDALLGHLHRGQGPRLAILVTVGAYTDVDLVRRRVGIEAAEDLEDAIGLDALGSFEVRVSLLRSHLQVLEVNERLMA